MTLPPFTLRPTCPKCSNDCWTWEYSTGDYIVGAQSELYEMRAIGHSTPHLRLTCDRCHYVFSMATKDAADAG